MNDCLESGSSAKWEDLPASRASERQIYAVKLCERWGAPRFRGKTLGSLSRYLSKYYENAKSEERAECRSLGMISEALTSLGGSCMGESPSLDRSEEEVESISLGCGDD